MNRRNESYTPLLCNYPDSEKINKVSEGAEAMFCRLLAKCDDDGNYHGEPKRLLGKLFTLRYENGTMTVTKVLRYRNELVTATLITCYVVDTVTYIHINNCKKSLRKDVAKKLFFPKFDQKLQPSPAKALNENVTGRNDDVTGRDENVTPIQSNPIQSNPRERERTTGNRNNGKQKHGEFVFLLSDEFSKLIERFGERVTKEKIAELNEAIGSKGYKYKSHYHTILAWDRRKKPQIKSGKELLR